LKKKAVIVIVCVVVAVFLGFGGKVLHDTARYQKVIADTVIATPDISLVQDGVYNGFFDAGLISVDVDVVVKGHRIAGITINEHHNGRGASAEVITEDVILNQTLDVDTVSGATNSSKVILKAIELALEEGVPESGGRQAQ